jgi:ATP-binding protein involved in chromosome partitioning
MANGENDQETQTHGMHPSFARVIERKRLLKQKLSGIRHIVGIYSAKGGVGKTTTAVNIAYGLKENGLKVGLLDLDVDCPNITMFTGIDNVKVNVTTFPIKPIDVEGIKVMSTATVVDELKRPIIWRGPMITKMIGELLENTDWGELDYLVLDLPPGTSDSPLTIMQLVECSFVIVTTPQRISALNSVRSGLMAKRMNAHLLGVIENMSSGEASKSTLNVVNELQTTLLGIVKLDKAFDENSDSGRIASMFDKRIAQEYQEIIRKLLSPS